jgi:hypothetical protein
MCQVPDEFESIQHGNSSLKRDAASAAATEKSVRKEGSLGNRGVGVFAFLQQRTGMAASVESDLPQIVRRDVEVSRELLRIGSKEVQVGEDNAFARFESSQQRTDREVLGCDPFWIVGASI